MKQTILARFVLFPIFVLVFVSAVRAQEPVETFEKGRLYRVGNYPVLVVEGTYREMGRQYGTLLKKEIQGMNEEVLSHYFSDPLSRLTLLVQADSLAKYLFERMPKRFRDIFEGMSETCGLSPKRLMLIDLVYGLDVLGANDLQVPPACASIACWGKYTGRGPLIVGRNFDYPTHYSKFNPFLCVVVYRPTDGCVATATLGYAGHVGALQIFNREGLMMELNEGGSVGGENTAMHINRMPFTIQLLQFGFDCETLNQMDAAIRVNRLAYPFLANVADTKIAYTYEMGSRDVVRRGDLNVGLQVVCNDAIDPYWNNGAVSCDRRNNLLALGEKHKGKIDLDIMKQIMETPHDKGGALVFGTIYQFVYEPNKRTLHLRTSEQRDWTPIPLKTYFETDD